MSGKVLVTYASRAGSTAGVAEAIGRTLAARGLEVEVRPMRDVQDLTPYTAVVAGSAIRGGKWLPEAVQWVKTHQAELARKPFAAFLVCITLAMPRADKYRAGVMEWLDPVRALVRPVSEGVFAGALDFSNVPLAFNTLLMRLAVLVRIFPRGDHRDWDAIAIWAGDLAATLQREICPARTQ